MKITSFNPSANQQLECLELLESLDEFFLDKREKQVRQTTQGRHTRCDEGTWKNERGLQWS